MTQFSTLLEAINHSPRCLLCQGIMRIQGGDITATAVNISGGPYSQLTFRDTAGVYTDEFIICVETGLVKRDIQLNKSMAHTVFVSTYCMQSTNPSPVFAGDKYLSMGIKCVSCDKYHYLVQIIVDLATSTISKILLNSETIIFSNDNYHEIKNIYTTGKTEYHYYDDIDNVVPAESIMRHLKFQQFPLISIDREQPINTLHRIQDLLPFV